MTIMELSNYQLEPLNTVEDINRTNIRISSKSRYGDNAWDFSSFEKNPNVKPSGSILRFDFALAGGDHLTDGTYYTLRETFKELIYNMASSSKGKLPSPATLKARYTDARFFITWLISNNIFSLPDLTREDSDKYILEVRKDNVHPMTRIGRLDALKHLWQHRKNIREPIGFDPLKGQSTHAVSAVTRQEKRDSRYDFIPDDLSQLLIRSCVEFIREKGVDVAVAVQARDAANLNQIRNGKSRANRDRAKKAALEQTGLTNAEVTTLSRQLLSSCYIIINFFTGIRASEMLSIGPDQIVTEDGTTWVLGRQHKIEKKRRRWMAPTIVYEAHYLAKSLTQSMRDSIDYEIENTTDTAILNQLHNLRNELFLNWSSRRDHGYKFMHARQVSNIKGSIHIGLNELVKLFDIVGTDGELWALHSHQFRKSFVRFMCSTAMDIRYLQEHMGHKSLDMTAWYDSDDIELTTEIIKQMKEFKLQKLDAIFNQNQKITGAGSESIINERRDYFVGIASIKSKEAFMGDLADDISLRGTGHSWCMGDSGNGNCTGVVGCMMDVSMTQKCSSALITEEHLPAWQEMKARNEILLESNDLGLYQKEAIKRVIRETIDPTIKALTGESEASYYGS